MSVKFKLIADPTFKAKVGIPVAGGEPVPVEFTFKHRTMDEFRSWREAPQNSDDVRAILDCVVAWELSNPLSEESVSTLVQNYHGAALAIITTYYRELSQAKLGNFVPPHVRS